MPAAGIAIAAPTDNGCPSAYTARTVDEWEALDSRDKLPAEIDDANLTPEPDGALFDGVAGNEDGIVCGRALPDGFTWGWALHAFGIPASEAPDTFYDFRDNDSPAAVSQASLSDVRAATADYHRLSAAEAAGYGPFYVCTDEPGQGAMGQHFVNLGLVIDGAIDPLRPEALMYQPATDGSYRLVGVEYLVFAAAWDSAHAAPPSLFGHTFSLVEAGNRYGLPPFYELHAWIWNENPNGMFFEWNPRITCAA